MNEDIRFVLKLVGFGLFVIITFLVIHIIDCDVCQADPLSLLKHSSEGLTF